MWRLFKLFRPRKSVRRPARRPVCRPWLEPLECRLAPAGVLIIDDGDAAFTTSGPGWTSFKGQGFQNDVTFAAPTAVDPASQATWTFTGLTPGFYRVSATWTSHPNRATNSPFTISIGIAPPVLLATVLVNQEAAPDDFSDAGAAWENLGGPYNLIGSTLTVRLSNLANQFVIADAIRIEMVDVRTSDNTTGLGFSGFSATGGFIEYFGQGLQNSVHYAASGSGTEQATWTFTGLTPGLYRVSATWTPDPNRATDAPFTVLDGTTVQGAVRVNQELAPDDLYAAGAVWEHLGGPYTLTGSTLTVRLTDQANEFVIADAIRIERLITNPVRVIDDLDDGFSTGGEWTTATDQGFQGGVTYSSPGEGDVAIWTFAGLVPGAYRVSITWSADPNRATNAPFTVLDGGTVRGTVLVNQQQEPDDFREAGAGWENLGGPFTVSSGTLAVRLSDLADGFVIADAVRIELVAENGTWSRLASAPLARQEVATAVLNDEIYVIAGFNAALQSTNDVQVYNPVTNTWRIAAPLPIINNHGSAAVANGVLYAFGGVSNRTFRYNPGTGPGTDSWTEVASMHFPHGNTVAVGVIDGRIYVAGGNGGGMVGNELEVYDPEANTWTLLASMNVARNHTGGGVINGLFYVVGGRDGAGAPTALEVYNPATNTWTTLASMPTGRSGIGVAVVNGLLYVFGGELPTLHSEVEVYNPVDNTWRQLSPMPTPRHGIWAAVIGNAVFLPVGATAQGAGATSTTEVFVIG